MSEEKPKKSKKSEERLKVEEELFTRQRNYQGVFDKESPTVQAVLADLSKFCRANESTFDTDPRIHALLEGRREVFLRLTAHLDLGSQDLWELYTKTKF